MIRTAVPQQSLAAGNRGINIGIVSQNPRRVYIVQRHRRAQGVVPADGGEQSVLCCIVVPTRKRRSLRPQSQAAQGEGVFRLAHRERILL